MVSGGHDRAGWKHRIVCGHQWGRSGRPVGGGGQAHRQRVTDEVRLEYFMPQEIFGQLSNAFFVHSGLQLNLGPAVAITGITNANPTGGECSCAWRLRTGKRCRLPECSG